MTLKKRRILSEFLVRVSNWSNFQAKTIDSSVFRRWAAFKLQPGRRLGILGQGSGGLEPPLAPYFPRLCVTPTWKWLSLLNRFSYDIVVTALMRPRRPKQLSLWTIGRQCGLAVLRAILNQHSLGSIPAEVMLLCPCKRHFATISSAWQF